MNLREDNYPYTNFPHSLQATVKIKLVYHYYLPNPFKALIHYCSIIQKTTHKYKKVHLFLLLEFHRNFCMYFFLPLFKLHSKTTMAFLTLVV